MDQIEIQTMTWHVSPYWLDTWHNIDVTRGMNNFQNKNLKNLKKKFLNFFKKIQKNSKKCGADTWYIFNTVNSILTKWA